VIKLKIQNLLNTTKTLNVLYVEDSEEARAPTIKMLKNYFNTIDVSFDGANGFEKFKSNPYHIIFTDLNMPVMDGVMMIKKIREFDLDVPIVILSAYDDKEYLLETIKHGIDGYLVKPYSFSQITEVINKIVLKLNIKSPDIVMLDFNYIWDKKNEQLMQDDEVIKLTKNEINLLNLLIQKENQTIKSEDIETYLFNDKKNNNTRIRNLISRLKTKLDAELIESNYGIGYKLKRK